MKKNWSRLLSISAAALAFATAHAADSPQWLREPALSADGAHIAFRSNGDVFVAAVASGAARLLRGTPAHERSPVWLGGARIAFAADTHGSYDVFVMNSDGTGEPQRLTWHSRDELPVGAVPDGASLLISSGRLDLSTSRAVYPLPLYDSDENSQTSPWTSLYSLSLSGGLPQLLVEPSSLAGAWGTEQRLVFSHRAGTETVRRKHERSSATQDIWLRERDGAGFRKLTTFAGTDAAPVWNAADGLIYFLSDRSGSLNVWRMPASGEASAEQVTRHALYPVEGLTVSRAGTIGYSFRGQLHVGSMQAGFRRLDIRVPKTAAPAASPPMNLGAFIRQAVPVPRRAESIVIARGQAYAFDRAGRQRLLFADRPGTKSWPTLSADGRRLLVVRDRGTASDLLLAELPAGGESWVDANARLRVTELAATRDEVILRAALSPDGSQAAYTTGLALRAVQVKGGAPGLLLTRAQGLGRSDEPFVWHPSGKHLALQWQSFHRKSSEIAVLSVDDGVLTNVTRSGFDDTAPQWSRDGRSLLWSSDRDGLRNFGRDGRMTDTYSVPVKPDLDTWLAALRAQPDEPAQHRARLTPSSAHALATTMAPDDTFLLQMKKHDGDTAIWRTPLPEGEPARIAVLPSRCDESTWFAGIDSLHVGDDERALAVSGCGAYWIDLAQGQVTAFELKAGAAAQRAAEQAWIFDHVVRTTDRVYFRPERLPVLQWSKHVAEHRRFLPAIGDPREFAELMNELLGELDASHTHFHFTGGAAREHSGSLGVIYASHSAPGWRIAEVMPGSPLTHDGADVRPGDVITALDGVAIPPGSDPAQRLLGTVGKDVEVTLASARGGSRIIRTQPVDSAAEVALAYERWVAWQRSLTAQLSGGALGYVHMNAMDEAEFRRLVDDVLGRLASKQGIVFDTRFNVGGWMHEPLLAFFSAAHAFDLRSNGSVYAGEPALRAGHPVVMLVNEANYSNASETPRLFRERGLARLVGAVVPGTGLGWYDAAMPYWDYYCAIAHDAAVTADGQFWEGAAVAPDVAVAADWLALRAGRDVQLEAAVKDLLEDLARRSKL